MKYKNIFISEIRGKTSKSFSYVLILELRKNQKIEIGKLGKIKFKKGFYFYVGRAEKKILKNRIKRHITLSFLKKGKLRWHIDYFLANKFVKVIEVMIFDNIGECELAKKISKQTEGKIFDFGCSDCDCEAHLFFNREIFVLNRFSFPKIRIVL